MAVCLAAVERLEENEQVRQRAENVPLGVFLRQGLMNAQSLLVLDLEKTLEKVKGEYNSVMEKDVPTYNKAIEGSGLKPLPTTGAPAPQLQ